MGNCCVYVTNIFVVWKYCGASEALLCASTLSTKYPRTELHFKMSPKPIFIKNSNSDWLWAAKAVRSGASDKVATWGSAVIASDGISSRRQRGILQMMHTDRRPAWQWNELGRDFKCWGIPDLFGRPFFANLIGQKVTFSSHCHWLGSKKMLVRCKIHVHVIDSSFIPFWPQKRISISLNRLQEMLLLS